MDNERIVYCDKCREWGVEVDIKGLLGKDILRRWYFNKDLKEDFGSRKKIRECLGIGSSKKLVFCKICKEIVYFGWWGGS